MLRSNQIEEVDWVTTNDLVSNQKDNSFDNSFEEQLIEPKITEANNWIINNTGEVMLIASALKSVHGSFITPAACPS